MLASAIDAPRFAALVDAEQARLTRLCGLLTDDADVAEDLAQETLLIAWRLRERVTDWEHAAAWLSAIARNVCRHWLRRQRRTARHLAELAAAEATAIPDEQAGMPDVEIELERRELETLLDRALALLPPDTREVLIQKYIEESPHAAIADRLGLSQNAVAVRLHRGRLAFQRVLRTTLRDDAAALGLIDGRTEAQPTPLWCPICGHVRLVGGFDAATGLLELRCPTCCAEPRAAIWQGLVSTARGPKSVRAVLFKGMGSAYDSFRVAAERGTIPCCRCGHLLAVERTLPSWTQPPYASKRGVAFYCATCDMGESISLRMLAQSSADVRRFWRAYPRMLTAPEREIEYAGRAAIVTTFHSAATPAHIDVISDRQTYALLEVCTNPAS